MKTKAVGYIRLVLAAACIFLAAAWVGGCGQTIPPGHVGIVVNKFGTNKGVQDYTAQTGWVGVNPFTEWVIEYPVFTQTVQWTKNTNEGNPYDESITFTTGKGGPPVVINADVSLSYTLAPESVPTFYVKFRNSDIKDFTYGYMHNVARDAFNEVAGKYTVEDIMGDNEEYLHAVKTRIQTELQPYGVTITQFGFIGAPRPPDTVREAINMSQQAKFLAQQKENEVAQAKADALKRVAAAEGEAQANARLTQSLTPQVLEFQRIQLQRQQLEVQDRWIARWNGTAPSVVMGGTGTQSPLMTLPLPTTTTQKQ